MISCPVFTRTTVSPLRPASLAAPATAGIRRRRRSRLRPRSFRTRASTLRGGSSCLIGTTQLLLLGLPLSGGCSRCRSCCPIRTSLGGAIRRTLACVLGGHLHWFGSLRCRLVFRRTALTSACRTLRQTRRLRCTALHAQIVIALHTSHEASRARTKISFAVVAGKPTPPVRGSMRHDMAILAEHGIQRRRWRRLGLDGCHLGWSALILMIPKIPAATTEDDATLLTRPMRALY